MEIVGWSMAERLKSVLCEDALKMAIRSRRLPMGLIHHSDRGVQGGFNRSSQHSGIGGCYDGTQTAVGMVDQPTAMDGSPRMKRLFQGIENKAGMGCPAHPLCAAVTNWSTEAAGIAQLRRSKTLPPVAFDPFGDGRWEDVHRGALSTRAAGVPC